jgi:hypothetical protein
VSRTIRIGRHEVPATPWVSPRVAPGPSPGRGRGLFAVDAFDEGEVVLVWGGESYGDAAAAAGARAEGRRTMRWDEDLFSREGIGDHRAFAINHACDPNVWLVDAFTLVARRPVAPGEELGLDYATILDDDEAVADWACRCGAPECRGRITGRDWRLKAIRERYAGHFSPWLERRIRRSDG